MLQGFKPGPQRWELDRDKVNSAIHRHKVNSEEWTRLEFCLWLSSPQGGQGKRVWLTVREPSMKAGWWDAPLALRDSVVSNVLDYPRHELLIAKLHAYGISFWHKATIKKSVGHMVNDTTCSIGFNSRAIIIQSFSLQLILLSERHRYSYNYSQNIWD